MRPLSSLCRARPPARALVLFWRQHVAASNYILARYIRAKQAGDVYCLSAAPRYWETEAKYAAFSKATLRAANLVSRSLSLSHREMVVGYEISAN